MTSETLGPEDAGGFSESNPSRCSEDAEQLFDLFIGTVEHGDVPEDFDRFCSRHPDHADAIRELYRDWRAFEDLAKEVRHEFGEPPLTASSADSGSALIKLKRLQERRMPEDFVAKGEIGQGGMGVVYRVWDEDLQRDLAMKVLRKGHSDGARGTQLLSRFLSEAQITGQLEHPGVIPVHHLGADRMGNAYFTMNLVKGRDLSEIFKCVRHGEKHWTQSRVIGVLLKVCDTLAYAHSKHVIHRDVKPANIMVGRFGEVYLMDWGLAKSLNDDIPPQDLDADPAQSGIIQTVRSEESDEDSDAPWVTMNGVVLGTPSYMAPEQACGRVSELSERADVYSVGAMLYELLSGHPPYVDRSIRKSGAETLEEIRRSPPKPIHEICPSCSPELEAIADKAMARNPDDRYETIQRMADDLRAFTENRVVGAYKTGALAELNKWVERNRSVASWIGITIASVLISLAALWMVEARRREEITEKAADLESAKALADEARHNAEVAHKNAAAEAAALEKTIALMEEMFSFTRPDNARGQAITANELIDFAARRLKDSVDLDPRAFARLSDCVGTLYLGLGNLELAEFHISEAVKAREENFEGGTPRWIESNVSLGNIYSRQGRFKDAREVLDRVKESLSQVGDSLEYQPSRLLYLSNRAALEVDSNNDAEAEDALELALEEAEKTLSDDDGVILVIKNNFGVIYERTHRLQEALDMFQEVLEQRIASYGDTHPDTMTCLFNISKVHSQLHDSEKALTYSKRCFELRLKVLGATHPETVGACRHHSIMLRNEGQHTEALASLESFYNKVKSELPSASPQMMDLRLELSQVYNSQGESEKALRLLLEEIDVRRPLYGTNHIAFADVLCELGCTYRWLRESERAEETLSQCLNIYRRFPKASLHVRANALSNLTSLYIESGEHGKAELIAREGYDFCGDAFPEYSPFRIRAILASGQVASKLGKIDIASRHFEEGYELAATHLREGHGIRTQAALQYGLHLESLGAGEDAIEIAETALSESDKEDALRGRLEELIQRLGGAHPTR